MVKFLRQPVARALHLSAFGVPLFVSGMMVSAWGLRHLTGLHSSVGVV
jgi:chlorophyll synthase